MGARGPKPQPPQLRMLRGNPGHRPINKGIKGPPAVFAEPDWSMLMPGDDIESQMVQTKASDEWRRVYPRLQARGDLSDTHFSALVDYCVCHARVFQCEREISRLGVAVLGERGWQKNPASTLVGQYRTSLARYFGEFGLTPSSEGSLKSSSDDHGNTAAAAILD